MSTGPARGKGAGLTPAPPGTHQDEVTVPADLGGERLDRALARLVPELSRTRARKVIAMGGAFVGNRRCRVASRAVRTGDVLTVTWRDDLTQAPEHPLNVAHVDEHLVVVTKPAGQHSQGTALGDVGTLTYALQHRFGSQTRLIHRLDAPASGLVLAGRDPETVRVLSEELRAHTVDRRYLAITRGIPTEGICAAPLRRAGKRSEVAPEGAPDGRTATTHFRVLERRGSDALVEARLETGRTHQVRVHLAHLGAPIIGDRLYGGEPGSRLCLHAWRLGFSHPSDGTPVALDARPPLGFWETAGWDPDTTLPETGEHSP